MHMWVNFAPVISYSAELWWATTTSPPPPTGQPQSTGTTH